MGYSEGTYGKVSVLEDFNGCQTSTMAAVRATVGFKGVLYSSVGEGSFQNTLDETDGVLQIISDTSDNDNFFLQVGPFKPVNGGCRMETRFKHNKPSSSAMFAGFAETSIMAADTPSMPCELSTVTAAPHSSGGFAGMLFDPDATTDDWYAVAGDAGTANAVCGSTCDSGIAPVSDAWDIVRVEVDETGKATIKLAEHEGSLKVIKEVASAVNPSDLFFAVVGTEARAALSLTEYLEVDYIDAQGFRDWQTS